MSSQKRRQYIPLEPVPAKRQKTDTGKKKPCICGCNTKVSRQMELYHMQKLKRDTLANGLIQTDTTSRLGLPPRAHNGQCDVINTTSASERVVDTRGSVEIVDTEQGGLMDWEGQEGGGQAGQESGKEGGQERGEDAMHFEETYAQHDIPEVQESLVEEEIERATRTAWASGIGHRLETIPTVFTEEDDDEEFAHRSALLEEVHEGGFPRFSTGWYAESSGDEDDNSDHEEDRNNPPGDNHVVQQGGDEDGDHADAYFRLQFQRQAAQSMKLEPSDQATARRYAFKVEGHLSDRLFRQLPQVYPETQHESLKLHKKHIESLSGFSPIRYHCCVNSCICFTGQYEELDKCPACGELRFGVNGNPRKYFEYIPLIPRLKSMIANADMYEKMQHRSRHEPAPNVIRDLYDGTHYQSLLNKEIPASNPPSTYFADERDIALGISTDGFGPFQRRDKTTWPIILFNYNLSPKIRFKKQYCINVGTIPGPRKPKDWDSFLWPLFEELVKLQRGVEAYDPVLDVLFLLCAFLVIAFGDIPAVSLMMRMKGHNGYRPCRFCNITGVRRKRKRQRLKGKKRRNIDPLYVPLSRSCVYEHGFDIEEEDEEENGAEDGEQSEEEREEEDEGQ
ncbi:hypothetical protein CVT24_012419, partial [Panaeolus cyanescens]